MQRSDLDRHVNTDLDSRPPGGRSSGRARQQGVGCGLCGLGGDLGRHARRTAGCSAEGLGGASGEGGHFCWWRWRTRTCELDFFLSWASHPSADTPTPKSGLCRSAGFLLPIHVPVDTLDACRACPTIQYCIVCCSLSRLPSNSHTWGGFIATSLKSRIMYILSINGKTVVTPHQPTFETPAATCSGSTTPQHPSSGPRAP